MKFAITERGTLKRCERRAVLTAKNGRNLTPLTGPVYLSTGTLCHNAHELWCKEPDAPLTHHVLTASVKMQDDVKARYKKATGLDISSDQLAATDEAIMFAVNMCQNYQDRWKTPLPANYKLISTEQKLAVPVQNTEHLCDECMGSGEALYDDNSERIMRAEKCRGCIDGTALHVLTGTVDILVQHVNTGRFDVYERKTYGAKPNDLALDYNDQFLGYIWMLRQVNVSDHAHVFYDGWWRRDKPPKGKTLEDLFIRRDLRRTEDEIAEFGRLLPGDLNKAYAVYTKGLLNASINRQWQGCWDCSVEKVCAAISHGEDYADTIAAHFTTRTDNVTVQEED